MTVPNEHDSTARQAPAGAQEEADVGSLQASLAAAELRVFRDNRSAWEFFSSLAPSYRHKALYWITSSRKPETRRSRHDRLIAMAAKKQKP